MQAQQTFFKDNIKEWNAWRDFGPVRAHTQIMLSEVVQLNGVQLVCVECAPLIHTHLHKYNGAEIVQLEGARRRSNILSLPARFVQSH
jgi:hypothetical protein